MKKIILSIFGALFVCSIILAQNATVKWCGTYAEKSKFVGNHKYVKGNDSYYLLMSTDGNFSKENEYDIFKIDTITFSTKKSVRLPRKYKNDDIFFNSMQFVDGNLHVYFSHLNTKGKNNIELLKQVYEPSLIPLGEIELISKSPTYSQIFDVGFFVKFENKETNEGTLLKSNANNSELIVDRFDLGFNKIKSTSTFKIPQFFDNLTLNNFQLNNDGELLFLSQPTQKAFTRVKKLEINLCKIDLEGKNYTKKIELSHNKSFVEVKYYFYLAKNNIGLFYAFYEDKGNAYFFVEKYNLQDFSVIATKTINLGNAKEKGLSSGFFARHKNTYIKFKPQVPTVDKDGNVHFVGEFIQPAYYSYDSKTGRSTKNNGIGEHIFYLVLNPDLTVKLNHLIPRYQKITSVVGENSSYLYNIEDDRTCFIFYDSDKNSKIIKYNPKIKETKCNDQINGSIYLTTIYLNGKATKEKLKLTSNGSPQGLNKNGNFNIKNSFNVGKGKFMVGYERNVGLLELNPN